MNKSSNITWHDGQISSSQREGLLGQKGCVIWLTGLSGSGKSTIARELEAQLIASDRACYVLDGDNVRHGLNGDLGFSDADRTENIRRISHVAALMADAGLIVITAFISPFRSDRKMARDLLDSGRFLEVMIEADLAACEGRDPKGLYKKARRGEIQDFTGIDSPYERPEKPEIVIDTVKNNPGECAEQLIAHLCDCGITPQKKKAENEK